VEELVVGILAFLALTLVGFGIFRGPDQSRPACAACRTDARRFAWNSPPVCPCGKRLDRPGAVRTHGRIRRPRLVVSGLIIASATALLATWTFTLRAQKLMWIDILPLRLRVEGLRRGADWAISSTERRQAARAIDAAEAVTLIAAIDEGRLALVKTPSAELGKVRSALLASWAEEPAIAAEVQSSAAEFSLALDFSANANASEPEVVPRGKAFGLVIQVNSGGVGRGTELGYFARIERVAINGREVPWKMECLGVSPTRVALGRGECTFEVPEDLAVGVAELTVDVLLVRTRAAWAALADERIDSGAPPETWGVPARVAHIHRTLPLNIVVPTP